MIQTGETMFSQTLAEKKTCPITQEEWQKLKNPVVAEDGHIYEEEALMEWLKEHKTSPITGEKIFKEKIVPAKLIINLYKDYYNANQKMIDQNNFLKLEIASLKELDKESPQTVLLLPQDEKIKEIRHVSTSLAGKEREIATEIIQRQRLTQKLLKEKNDVILKKYRMKLLKETMEAQLKKLQANITQTMEQMIQDTDIDINDTEKKESDDLSTKLTDLTQQVKNHRNQYQTQLHPLKEAYNKAREQFKNAIYQIDPSLKNLTQKIDQHSHELRELRENIHDLTVEKLMQTEEKLHNSLSIFGGMKKISCDAQKEKKELKKVKHQNIFQTLSHEEQEKLSSDLFHAIQINNISSVQDILSKGIDINILSKRTKLTPLMAAVLSLNVEIVDLLLINHADLNAKLLLNSRDSKLTLNPHPILKRPVTYHPDSTPLLFLFAGSKVEDKKYNKEKMTIAKKLLEHKASINTYDSQGQTALHEAVKCGDIEIIKLFLEYKANINMANIFEETALSILNTMKENSNDVSSLQDLLYDKLQADIPLFNPDYNNEEEKSLVSRLY